MTRRPKGLHPSVRIYDGGYRGDCPKEYVEQINAVSWFRLEYPHLKPLFFHPFNEGKKSAQWAAKQAKMGLQPGIPDLVLLLPEGGYHYALFELKRTGKGYLTQEEKNTLNDAAEVGAFACMCRGAEQFKLAVADYLGR